MTADFWMGVAAGLVFGSIFMAILAFTFIEKIIGETHGRH